MTDSVIAVGIAPFLTIVPAAGAPGSRIHLRRGMLPGVTFPAFGRQEPFHQLAHVGERAQLHDRRDFQRPGQWPFPVRTPVVALLFFWDNAL
jgi:hypothetical protein